MLGAAAPPSGAPAYGPPPYGAPPYGAPPMPAYPYAGGMYDAERGKQIDRTKTGLLLLLIGGLISWIPYIGILGGLLLLIGAILVILGRKAFGATHSRNVVLALVLFFVGFLIGAIAGVAFAAALFSAAVSQDPTVIANAFASAFSTLLIGAIIAAAVGGLASVLFTYALQQNPGKMLLWAGYGANLAISIAVFAIFSPLVSNAIQQAVSGGTYDPTPILAVQSQITALGLLGGIPALLYAAATYLAWSRVKRGEIPAPVVPPGMPTPPMGMPPSGPAPPINPQ